VKPFVLLMLAVARVPLGPITVDNISDSERAGCAGTTDLPCQDSFGSSNNGASPGNNYSAGWFGSTAGFYLRDWFEFSIPSISLGETLESATLELYEPSEGH